MDLFKINEQYRKFYTFHKKSEIKPNCHIDSVATYLIHIQQKDLDLFKKFGSGMTSEEFAPYFKFINQNAPMGNLKIIIELRGEYDTVYCYECRDTFVASVSDGSLYGLTYLGIAALYNTLHDLNEKNTRIAVESVEYRNKRTGRMVPDEVIYISRDKEEKKIYPAFGGSIEWKHSWSVMGHWRVVKGIGKNKKGERSVFGKTWVVPCIKGDGHFIEKIRIVK